MRVIRYANKMSRAAGLVLVLGLGAGVLSGCQGTTPKDTTNTASPGGMSADQQKQYEQQMQNMKRQPPGRPMGPGGRPGGPSGPGGPPR